MKGKREGKDRKKTTLELLITEDGNLVVANAGTSEMKLIEMLSERASSRGEFYCG